MPDRVLGPGATGLGKNGDQTDPPETDVEAMEEPAPLVEEAPALRVPPTPPPADPPAPTQAPA